VFHIDVIKLSEIQLRIGIHINNYNFISEQLKKKSIDVTLIPCFLHKEKGSNQIFYSSIFKTELNVFFTVCEIH